ncbi:Dolichyl-diphosphooligosaccharide-protein glycosyltransferase 48kDa subunit [Backusella circina FSU 941]|nr:Dolichyl-diphosphooligosaccharide-protein glycosyltransferase 48kDa subunit [Backusella circina FSU 941]
MRSFTSLITLVASSLFVLSEARSVSGNRVLVLLDAVSEKDNYIQFWSHLEERDFDLTFSSADDAQAQLVYFGEDIFNHIIHFAPNSKGMAQHKALNNIQLVDFVNRGGNLLIAASPEATDNVRALAAEFDIEVETDKVYDHNAYKEEHDKIVTDKIVGPSTIVDALSAPILYSGTGLVVGSLPLSSAVLNVGSSGFISDSYSKRREASPVTLAATMQTRNSARVAVVGSLDVFSDNFVDAEIESYDKTGNEEFINQLTQWTFQEKSVLKIVDRLHHKENETEQLDWYRVKDDVVYTIDISEYKNDKWVPFKADDVQLEVIMLDPYIRTTLKQVPGDETFGRFESHLRLPDVYGVFTFKVNYKRAGYTYLKAEDRVSIRPFRHNEYPRFLTAALPYYISTGSMIVGFLVFSAVWLSTWGKEPAVKKAKSN